MADNIGQILYKVKIPQDGSETTYPAGIDIYSEILSQVGTTNIKKLGIQAPSGTICYVNDQEIMIGRTGIYELDEVISITSLRFARKQTYLLDSSATASQLQDAKNKIKAAENKRKTSMNALSTSDPDYYDKYIVIQEQYYKEYSIALELYNEALQGIYIRGGEEDLENVIIDYLY